MLNYIKVYKEYGIRKITDIITPKTKLKTSFDFPKESVVLYNKPSDVHVSISEKEPILNKVKKGVIACLTEYSNAVEVEGSVIHNKKNVVEVYKNTKKKNKEFKVYFKLQKIRLTSKTTLIVDTSGLNSCYRYQQNPLNDYYKWKNCFSTLLRTISSDRHKFINFELPASMPSMQRLKLYLEPMNKLTLSKMSDAKSFNLLELFKFISDEYRNDSVLFNNIKKEEYSKTTLMLSFNNKMLLLNLKLLDSMRMSSETDGGIQKFKNEKLRKLIYVMVIIYGVREHRDKELNGLISFARALW